MSRDVEILDDRTPQQRERTFLPGMGKSWLMPFYDWFSRFSGVRRLHERAVALAGVEAGQRVIDVGCGTGNLALALLRAQPAAHVTGLDPDAGALRRAGRKTARRGLRITLVQGYADRLPAEDGSVDHVVSALALHHVDEDGRAGFAREVARVLRPGGRVTIADFGGPHGGQGHGGQGHGGQGHGGQGHGGQGHGGQGHGGQGHGGQGHGGQGHGDHGHGRRHGGLRHLRGGLRRRTVPAALVSANLDGGLVTLLTGAGLADAREVDHVEHSLGPVTFVQATRA